jgi:MtN3 and saliva related transmembrane protein|tara:strand:- start:321 stop:650 length:330 start_codon:yes stop_codon:yes gene_type:complete
MSLVLFFGYLAGFLTTVSLIPQVIKMKKTKSADDFSLAMLLIWCSGIACWVGYGILMSAEPIIFWNLGTLLLAGSILGMKIKYTGKQAQETKPIAAKKKPIKDLKDWGV